MKLKLAQLYMYVMQMLWVASPLLTPLLPDFNIRQRLYLREMDMCGGTMPERHSQESTVFMCLEECT